MNAKLTRQERRARQKHDAQLLGKPLDRGTDPRPMAAHVRHVFNLLRDHKLDSPCSKAVAHVTSLFDRTAPAHPLIACRKGCSHCCTQKVVLTAPEAFFVAARIKENPKAKDAIIAAHRRTHAMSLEGRLQAQIFCALLEDSICSIYTARPLACHAFVSTDLEACLAAFTRDQPANIPMPSDYVDTVHACRILLMAALRIARLPSSVYEMNAALAVILAQENAEARWLAGENVLAGVPVQSPPPPQFEQAIRQMAVYVAQSL
jgi:Fe-S-cluster containining protein